MMMMMMRILLLGVVQSLLLCGGQVLLKFALLRMGNFTWTLDCFVRNLTNWWLLGCGLCYACATALWLYIVRTFPFSMASDKKAAKMLFCREICLHLKCFQNTPKLCSGQTLGLGRVNLGFQ